MNQNSNSKTKAYVALGIVCFFWGTTYLALRIGVSGFPPFLFSAIRQIAAGVILLVLLLASGKSEHCTLRDIAKQIIPGILLISIGNGVVGWAELYIPSGLAALIIAIVPIYILGINLAVSPSLKLSSRTIMGLLLGASGILLIFRDNLNDITKPEFFWGIMACFGSSLCWAIGSVYMKNATFRTNAYTNASIQCIAGGTGLLLASLVFDDYSQLSTIQGESLWALLYLTLFGSLLTYLAYLYAIEKLPVMLVATYAYVNPVIAIFLGFLILDEAVTWLTVLALATVLCGVYVMSTSQRPKD